VILSQPNNPLNQPKEFLKHQNMAHVQLFLIPAIIYLGI